MKIAVIGADGQLGSDLVKILKGKKVFPLYYPDFDVTKPEKMKKILSQFDIEFVINTASFNRVNDCEEDSMEAFKVNAIAVRDLALICKELNLVFVHFSTDYVFDGKKKTPYVEEDYPHPLNVYGVSKLSGEYFVRNLLQRYFLIRTCGLYGEAGCWGKGSNFIDKIISLEKKGEILKIVDDQTVTPTSTAELALKIKELIQTQDFGLYHLTNEGQCTWFEFAKTIFQLIGKKAQLLPIDSKSYGARAVRPVYSVLENKKAKNVGLSEFSHWKDALKKFLENKGFNKSL